MLLACRGRRLGSGVLLGLLHTGCQDVLGYGDARVRPLDAGTLVADTARDAPDYDAPADGGSNDAAPPCESTLRLSAGAGAEVWGAVFAQDSFLVGHSISGSSGQRLTRLDPVRREVGPDVGVASRGALALSEGATSLVSVFADVAAKRTDVVELALPALGKLASYMRPIGPATRGWEFVLGAPSGFLMLLVDDYGYASLTRMVGGTETTKTVLVDVAPSANLRRAAADRFVAVGALRSDKTPTGGARAVLVDASGTPVSGEVTIAPPLAGDRFVDLVALPDGTYLSFWSRPSASLLLTRVLRSDFTFDGSIGEASWSVAASASDARLATGPSRAVVSWREGATVRWRAVPLANPGAALELSAVTAEADPTSRVIAQTEKVVMMAWAQSDTNPGVLATFRCLP
jgi:hypothetical protein